jgi:hypothetical protein
VLIAAGLLVAATVGGILFLARPRSGGGLAAVDLEDGSRARAEALGLTLPEGASHVYIKARAARGATVRYVRFDLSADRYAGYRAELAARPGVDMTVGPSPPRTWPRFRELPGFGPPGWFMAYRQNLQGTVAATVGPREAAGGAKLLEGEFWVLDDRSARVFVWSWRSPRAMASGLSPARPHP